MAPGPSPSARSCRYATTPCCRSASSATAASKEGSRGREPPWVAMSDLRWFTSVMVDGGPEKRACGAWVVVEVRSELVGSRGGRRPASFGAGGVAGGAPPGLLRGGGAREGCAKV